ncbi:MAG: hypothetical protein OXI87_00835 [Albidovulum sp.]|nr:hypothetical protein [Albidovulum sp.]
MWSTDLSSAKPEAVEQRQEHQEQQPATAIRISTSVEGPGNRTVRRVSRWLPTTGS